MRRTRPVGSPGSLRGFAQRQTTRNVSNSNDWSETVSGIWHPVRELRHLVMLRLRGPEISLAAEADFDDNGAPLAMAAKGR